MRKLITVIMIFALLLPALVLAEWNLDELTYEELETVNSAIQLKMFEKQSLVDGAKVPSGEYVVGKDIPSGTYRIEYRPKTDYDFVSFIAMNENDETWLSFVTIIGFNGTSEIGKLELPDETKVTITGGDVYFFTYTGLFH